LTIRRATLALAGALIATLPAAADEAAPKRLLHFQTVGFSNDNALGRVSPLVVSEEDGWQPYLDHTLGPIVERLGPDRFDLWLSNPGGIWDDLVPMMLTETNETYMLFEQMALARERFPQLVDYTLLAGYAEDHGIDLYAYIGVPRCDAEHAEFVFEPRPDHADPAMFNEWYGEFVTFGFKGVGHDFSAALTPDSAALSNNIAMLEAAGMEIFIESVPWWSANHFLGYGVVAEEWLWDNARQYPGNHMQESEIIEAGGRTIHLVLRPLPGAPVFNLLQWRFGMAKRLLGEGKTVAVPLEGLLYAGYPIEQLANLAQGLPAEGPEVIYEGPTLGDKIAPRIPVMGGLR